MNAPKNLQIPKNSPVLLDTNVLVDSVENGPTFQDFFAALNAIEAKSVLSAVVELEFRRGFSSSDKPTLFLDKWFGKDRLVLPLDNSLYQYVYEIDRINHRQGNQKVKLGDLLISAQMAKYSIPKREKYCLLLATQNHKDFSPAIFDLRDVINLRTPSGVIKTIGMYQFSPTRFDALRMEYS